MGKFILIIALGAFISGCGPSAEQREQWAVEACMKGYADVRGMPKSPSEYEDARKYCVQVHRGYPN